jgi:hypothetical protein
MLDVLYHESFERLDPSKMIAFETCPRKFFYRYVLGWTVESANNHLIFGQAIHKAMEQIYVGGFTAESVDLAYKQLTDIYRASFDESTDELYFPKVPGIALIGLVKYIDRYKETDRNVDVLHTEASGTVPISPERRLYFRLDNVSKGDRGYYTLEHKTASQNSNAWHAQWELSLQILTYIHVLMCLYPGEEVYGAIVNGLFFYKRQGGDVEFERVPILKTEVKMKQWLWTVNFIYDMIEHNYEELKLCTPQDEVMMCFPMRSTSCTDYNVVCPYHAFCSFWSNPLAHIDDVPAGYKKEFWDPSEYEHTATTILKI